MRQAYSEADYSSLYQVLHSTQTTNMALPFLKQHITREAVIRKLIHFRCKEAEKIQRKLVVGNIAVPNGSRADVKKSNEELYALFPPRRQWVHIGSDSRKGMTQVKKNERNLWLTVKREQKKDGQHAGWYERLEARTTNIVKAALTSEKLFEKPNVTVIEKKRDTKQKTIECRPICLFKTQDERIYASLYNKVFTHLFDDFFYENSFAFRVAQEHDDMMHLKAVRKIKTFRKEYEGELCVAECDMKKFYDTLDHDIIKKRFCQMLSWKKQAGVITREEERVLKRVIFGYVDCFNFYQDVFKYNSKPNHLIWKHIENSTGYKKVIKWVDEDIRKIKDKGEWPYRTKKHDKYQLGVPQGGALSGVIANVVMHFTDMKLRRFWQGDTDFLYLRFCDDMIMMGKDKKKVTEAFDRYETTISDSHLYMHPSDSFDGQRMKDFWNGKTRDPYLWGTPAKNVMPWITFVGYDVNWEGDTRIRKSSLKKEIRKQYEKRVEIEHLLGKMGGRQPQWDKAFIRSSVYKRMIGMSVGRVPIWSYKEFDNKFSWAKAFTELTDNRWSRAQLRLLDKHRVLMIKRLGRFLEELAYENVKPADKKAQRDALWFYGKPFSYYGQVLKKWD